MTTKMAMFVGGEEEPADVTEDAWLGLADECGVNGPLLLRELERDPDHWFAALKAITGANPADPADRGRIDKLAAAWLKWGKEAGYQW